MANPNTIPYYRYQDIQIPDVTIRQQFENNMSQGQYSQGLALLENNAEQLSGKAFIADLVNALSNGILTLEQLFEEGVVQYLSQLQTNNQILIDNLKKIGMWNINSLYKQNNFVVYNNLIYFCIKDTIANIQITDTNYWLQLGLRGLTGAPGLDVVMRYNWSQTANYQVNDVVVYDGNFYVCIEPNSNIFPTSPYYWQPFLDINKAEIYVGPNPPTKLSDNTVWIQTEADPDSASPGTIIIGQFQRYVQDTDSWENMNPNVLLGQVANMSNYATTPRQIEITIPANDWVNNEWSYTLPYLTENNIVDVYLSDDSNTSQKIFFDSLEIQIDNHTIILTTTQTPVPVSLVFNIVQGG